jgi:hypothetical protein
VPPCFHLLAPWREWMEVPVFSLTGMPVSKSLFPCKQLRHSVCPVGRLLYVQSLCVSEQFGHKAAELYC